MTDKVRIDNLVANPSTFVVNSLNGNNDAYLARQVEC